MNGPAAFWIAIAVFLVCEAVITLHGIDTMFWKFKTPNELEYQRKLMGLPPADGVAVRPHDRPLCADCTTEHACKNRLDVPRPCGVEGSSNVA